MAPFVLEYLDLPQFATFDGVLNKNFPANLPIDLFKLPFKNKKKIENSRINQFFKTSFTSILQTEKKTKHNGENH